MAKITRKTQKIFGGSAGSAQIGQYGSLAAGSPTTTTDPAVVQSLSNWEEGWDSAVIGNDNPAIEDLNGVDFVTTYQIAYTLQQGIPEYDPGTVYYTHSLAMGSTGVIFQSLTDANTGNDPYSGSPWINFNSNSNVFPNGLYLGGSSGTFLAQSDGQGLAIGGSNLAALQSVSNSTINISEPGSPFLGYPIVVSATPSTSGLLIVRGIVSFSGSVAIIISGEGFTPTRTGTGQNNIVFGTSFLDTPSVVATPIGGGSGSATFNCMPYDLATTGFSLDMFANTTLTDFSFSFIAVGQRR